MSDILHRQNVSVETDCDRVILTVSRTQIPIPYAATFRIAAHLKQVCKQAMRVSYEPLKNWQKLANLDRQVKVNQLNPEKRSTAPLQNFEWRVETEGEMTYLVLGNNSIGFHFEAGLQLSQWLRTAAAQAKNWAGDGSKAIHCVGTLTDAEQNYKYGYE